MVGHLAHQASQPSAAQEAGVFFRSDARGAQRARCVLVDTEPKVIASARSGSVGRLYDPARCYVGQSGRGNNWAFGYTDMVAGPKTTRRNPSGQFVTGGGGGVDDGGGDGPDLLHAVLEGIRREVEECDSAPDFLLVHSLAGGSGSGLGCRLLEALRESYDLNYIASVSVAPRHDGAYVAAAAAPLLRHLGAPCGC